jgi:hypothetical protein
MPCVDPAKVSKARSTPGESALSVSTLISRKLSGVPIPPCGRPPPTQPGLAAVRVSSAVGSGTAAHIVMSSPSTSAWTLGTAAVPASFRTSMIIRGVASSTSSPVDLIRPTRRSPVFS